jgi:hypothetical protein
MGIYQSFSPIEFIESDCADKGSLVSRVLGTSHASAREFAFAVTWADQNTPVRDTLQMLYMAGTVGIQNRMINERDITTTDRELAARLMQWLGSPVGFDYLTEALDVAGYEIKPK